ncbi:MAG: long-chain fatty acid--CoA ligase [Gordonia sp. (in: high G+C Gram-positive bacteria)]
MTECRVPAAFTFPPERIAADILFDIAATDPARPVFWRQAGDDWQPITAGDAADTVRAVAKGLVAYGVNPGDRVALMSSTRAEWPLIDIAIWTAGAVTVPIFDTSSASQVDWIVQDSAAATMIVETSDHYGLLGLTTSVTPATKVFLIDEPGGGPGAVNRLTQAGQNVGDDVLAARRRAVGAASPATLIYTSGTTGRPKGVLLTHANLLSEAEGCRVALASVAETAVGKRVLMFLPLAHVLARTVNLSALLIGFGVGYTSDTANLASAFTSFRPSGFVSVPRVFEKVYASARKDAYDAGDRKGKVFDSAVLTALDYSEALDTGRPNLGLRTKHRSFDKVVYSKLRAAMGGQCEFVISGGAALNIQLAHFYRGTGVPVYEGYGLTETSAAICVNTPTANRIGTVGRPVSGNAVRIAPDGEILLAGAVVFGGYWRNPEATAGAIVDGWFHTGDLGALDADGFLSITGRKKEIIVTAGGKNVAPAPMEDIIRTSALISNVVVVGEQKPFVSALITIDPAAFTAWKARSGKAPSASLDQLIDDPALLDEVQAAVDYANHTVSRAERIRRYRLLTVDFTEETGELTPTLKVKRDVVAQKFADDIDAMYDED